jgi:alpha(1,3/1,4) fucosyltransferase
MKPVVKIRYVNFFDGFDDDRCRSHVLMDLCNEFDFVFCKTPDILLVGCYDREVVPATDALKVGYYTENLAADLTNFDYFFGCEYSDVISDPKYCKRVYGPLQADLLEGCPNVELALSSKTRFCNFIYSHRVPYRERFFKELTRYRTVSAPGLSMNNCSDLSARSSKDWQKEKIDYLRSFKFTVAFENSRRIGYATEKLYDAFRADTVPVYWGDPGLDSIVNRDALIVVDGDWDRDVLPWLRLPEKRAPFKPYSREPFLLNKLCGRCNDLTDWLRARIPYNKGFASAIEQIVALDRDDNAYKEKLSQPRLKRQVLKMREEYSEFWRKIIKHAKSQTAGNHDRDFGRIRTARL